MGTEPYPYRLLAELREEMRPKAKPRQREARAEDEAKKSSCFGDAALKKFQLSSSLPGTTGTAEGDESAPASSA